MSNYISGPNLGLLVSKAHNDTKFAHSLVTNDISEDILVSGTTASNAVTMPLYLYPSADIQSDAFASKQRTVNFDPELYASICKAAKIEPEKQAEPDEDFRASTGDARPSEVKIFDYIYGVLHLPAYRGTYSEFLKIDFPRVPYPPSPEVFQRVSEKGEALRRLHLMEAATVAPPSYAYHGEGTDEVAAGYPKFANGRILINADQYFDNVPEIVWSFFICGCQPAQKWLKDRRGRTLSWEDIGHYQQIINILNKTDKIMPEIDFPMNN